MGKRIIKAIRRSLPEMALISMVVMYIFHTTSCANTKGTPTGGPKDTIPPVAVLVEPQFGTKNFPREKGSIKITFNEYVQIKDAAKNILISPPLSKRIKTRIKGKSVVVEFPVPLDSAKSYTIYFGKAICDNNEGNQLPGFSYSFSTGESLDTMLISGRVIENSTLKPVKEISVAAYLNPTDSCAITTLPDAITKTDDYGYFALQHLKAERYALFAFSDENGNNRYDQGSESIAFLDSMVTPSVVMYDHMPQTEVYDPKDTASFLARPVEHTLYLFNEKPAKQYISNKGRPTRRGCFIKFNSVETELLSLQIKNLDTTSKILKQFNPDMDSLSFWIAGGPRPKDTLHVSVEYMKMDSTGKMSPFKEELALVAPRDKSKNRNSSKNQEEVNNLSTNYLNNVNTPGNDRRLQQQREQEKRKREQEEREKNSKKNERADLLKMRMDAKPEMVEETGYMLSFPEPLATANFDSITMECYNPRKQRVEMALRWVQDSTDILKYAIWPKEDFKIGYEYILHIPTAAFKDINGFTNDSLDNKLFLPTDDNLSTISVKVQGVDTRYIVELVNDKCTTIYGTHIFDANGSYTFKYLKEGNYSIRITKDNNRNRKHDTGSLIPRRQPEPVRFYLLPNGGEIIKLMERTDLEQVIELESLFGK